MNANNYSAFVFASLALLIAAPACLPDPDDDDGGNDSGNADDDGDETSGDASDTGETAGNDDDGMYVLSSVVANVSGRTTYVQVLRSLDVGHVTNDEAIEISGNGVFTVHERDIFVGLAEEPTWIRYTVDDEGGISESERLSFLNQGLSRIDYGNAIISDELAISISSEQYEAIVWNPQEMVIVGTIPLPHLELESHTVEVWTTIAHEGLVYVPGRWANWESEAIPQRVSLTIIDPQTREVLGVAEDDRCASGGRIVFADDGYGYVMGDGRNYSAQMYANAKMETPPKNCLLRIAPGELDFDPDFFVEIPSLSGGLESVTELETGLQGSGFGFTKMFYPDELPDGVEPVDFDFWGHPVFKMWRIELGDEPTAVEVQGLPFSTLGFEGSAVDGKLYSGEAPNYATSIVYEIDPETNTGVAKFEMDGLFYGLAKLD